MIDIIDREHYGIHQGQIEEAIGGKTVLITGAGGSIGSELTRMIAEGAPKHIVVLSHSEYPLYSIESEINNLFPEVKCTTVLADIRAQSRIKQVCEDYQPDIIFHTAAIKHLPMAEKNPNEAVLTNVIGTRNIIAGTRKCGAKLVYISTDKAVNPISVMGATKRAAERLCSAEADLDIRIVRFGNVIGTSGSVVPLFEKQIANGHPITITHPKVARYFMTVNEAAALIIQTLNITVGSKLFVLDMGKPVKIHDLAVRMIAESGKDIAIEFTGLRPGEKVDEELFYKSENPVHSRHDGIFQGLIFPTNNASFDVSQMEATANYGKTVDTLIYLSALVPEYTPIVMT